VDKSDFASNFPQENTELIWYLLLLLLPLLLLPLHLLTVPHLQEGFITSEEHFLGGWISFFRCCGSGSVRIPGKIIPDPDPGSPDPELI
jgi:hypothetical protein